MIGKSKADKSISDGTTIKTDEIRDKPRASSARSTLGVLVTKVVSLPLTIVVGIIVTRVLGPANKGSYVFVGLLGSFYLPWASFGLGASTIYFISSGRYAVRDVFGTCFLSGIAQGVLTAAVLGILWRFDLLGVTASEVNAWIMIPALLLLPVQGAFLMITRLLLGDSRFAFHNLIILAQPLLSSAMLVLFVVVLRWDLPGAVAAFIASNVLIFVVSLGAVISRYRPRLNFHPAFLRESIGYGLKAWGGDLATRVNLRFDQAALSLFATDAQLGVYSVAVTLSELLWFVPDSMALVLFNRIVGTPSIEDRAELACRVHRVLILCIAAAAIVLALAAPWLIRFAYGDEFVGAIWPMIILLPGTLAMTTAKIVTKFLSGSGQPGRSSLLVAAGAVTSVLVGIVLIPVFGMIGAALTSTIGYVVTGVAAFGMFAVVSPARRPRLFGISTLDIRWFAQQIRSLLPGRRPPVNSAP